MPDARLAPLPDTPRITVFTTVYNQEAFVADAIESVLAQDWPADRLQYVVVDDGSTDASPEIIAAYAERTPPTCAGTAMRTAG